MKNPITWHDAIAEAVENLTNVGIEDGVANAEYCAVSVLGLWQRKDLRIQLSREVESSALEKFRALIARRMLHEPLQYVVGEWEFHGIRLYTTPAALIPRPETETLVYEAVAFAADLLREGTCPVLLDIGTGSGAIPLAFCEMISHAVAIGVDISPDAINLAESNRVRLGYFQAHFYVTDIFTNEIVDIYGDDKVDILVSNPPYVSLSEYETLAPELRLFEPREALTDEADGLRFYKRIADVGRKILKESGRVMVEMGYDNAPGVQETFESAGYETIRIVKDLAGIPRVYMASFRQLGV